MKFVNNNIVALLYSQDNSEKVQEILKNISSAAVQQDTNLAPLTVGIESTSAINPTELLNQGSSAVVADGTTSTSVGTSNLAIAVKPTVRIR